MTPSVRRLSGSQLNVPLRHPVGAWLCSGRRLSLIFLNFCGRFLSGTRPVPGQSPVLTRAACGRVPTGSYSSAGQLSGPWQVPGGIPTGSSRVFEQLGARSLVRTGHAFSSDALKRARCPLGSAAATDPDRPKMLGNHRVKPGSHSDPGDLFTRGAVVF
ncbi:hypothetical protein Bbelb_416300 [Branchiostoma belcheri]|nr:hypothetical protein Bbelb_416300 [Branchiostoma belcheri]